MKGSEKKGGILKFFSKLVKKKDKQRRDDEGSSTLASRLSVLEPEQQEAGSTTQLEKRTKGGGGVAGSKGSKDIKKAMDTMDSSHKSTRIPLGTVKSKVEKFSWKHSKKGADSKPDLAAVPQPVTQQPSGGQNNDPSIWVPRKQTKFSQPPSQPRSLAMNSATPDGHTGRCIGEEVVTAGQRKHSSADRSPSPEHRGSAPTTTTSVLPTVYPRHIPLTSGPLPGDTDSLDAVIPPGSERSSWESLTTAGLAPASSSRNSPRSTVRGAPAIPPINIPTAATTSRSTASQVSPQPASHHPKDNDTVIHYHVTLQNCDGINIHVSDSSDGGALSPRGIQFDERGVLKQLSWMEGGAVPRVPSPRAALAIEDASFVESRSHPGSLHGGCSSVSGRGLRVGSSAMVPEPRPGSSAAGLSESPPSKTAKVVPPKHGTPTRRRFPTTLEKSASKSTPELRVPDLSTVPKTNNVNLLKGKRKGKRRRTRPKSQNMDTEECSETAHCDRTVSIVPSQRHTTHATTTTTMEVAVSPHLPAASHATNQSRSESDNSISSVLSQVDTDAGRAGSAGPPPTLSNASSSGSDGSLRYFPWHYTREAATPPAPGGHRRLARPVPVNVSSSCVQGPFITATPSTASATNTSSVGAQFRRSAPVPIAPGHPQTPSSVAVKPKPGHARSSQPARPGPFTSNGIFGSSDAESSGSGGTRPVATVAPVLRPVPLPDSDSDSPGGRGELQILQLENQRSALMLQLQQEQERTALLDDLQRQQEEFEEQMANRETEFIREEAERRSRRQGRRAARSQERETRSAGNEEAPRRRSAERGRGGESRSRERRARVGITPEGSPDAAAGSLLSPQVEAEVSAMEEAFRREVAERRSRRYSRRMQTGSDEGHAAGCERQSRRDMAAAGNSALREEGRPRPSSGAQRRARFDDDNLTQICGEPEVRRRPRSLSASRSSGTGRNRLNRSNSVSVPESDDEPLSRHLVAVKNQLVSVPGVLIVGSKRGRLVAYLSRDRPNIDGVVRFMIDHSIQRAEYECEIVPYRYRTRRKGSAAGTPVYVAS